MSQHNEMTEKEIDSRVIAEADDPAAWEEEAIVHPRRWRVNPTRLDLAAKFFVLSALHRLVHKRRLRPETPQTSIS